MAHTLVHCITNPVCQQRGKDDHLDFSADAGPLTLVVGRMLAELLDERIHLGMHHHLVLIPDAVLSQEVKLDMVTWHALHILNLHKTTQALTTDKQQHKRSFQSRNVCFNSDTSSLHWKSKLRNAWGQ